MTCQADIESGIAARTERPRWSIGRRLACVVRFVMHASEVARQRRQLLRLDDRMLKDIGASRADAVREGTRAWWDVPDREC